MLCANCDNVVIENYESALHKLISQKSTIIEEELESNITRFSQIDYLKVKKAILSILWRMSLSTQKIYKSVSLGSKHNSIIRDLLYTDTYIPEDKYQILICIPLIGNEYHENWMLEPIRNRSKNRKNYYYHLLLAGMLYSIEVGSAQPNPLLEHYRLKADGTCVIARKETRDIPMINKACYKIAQATETRTSG